MTDRCTDRKHVVEKTGYSCDCGRLMIWDTAARNARVVSLAPEWHADGAPILAEEKQTGFPGSGEE